MTITITKSKLAIAILAVALLVPATALATHVFSDVPDDKFYAQPVEWAANNGITTGKSPTIFDPEGAVTRGESVTFLKRYDDNIVQPALDDLNAPVPAFYAVVSTNPVPGGGGDRIIFDSESLDVGDNYDTTTGIFTVPKDGIYQLTFVTHYNNDGGYIQMTKNGADVLGPTWTDFDNNDEPNAVIVVTADLAEGDEITVERGNATSLWGTTQNGAFTYFTGHLIQAS